MKWLLRLVLSLIIGISFGLLLGLAINNIGIGVILGLFFMLTEPDLNRSH